VPIPGFLGLLSNRRAQLYLGLAASLVAVFALARNSAWSSGADFHTVLEVTATLLALMVGVMALVRFYSRKNTTILFIGTAFLGTGFLDGYHALVTSAYLKPFMPSDLPSLIPWSWVASRLFLAVFLWLSWVAWRRETRARDHGHIRHGAVYLAALVLTAASFLFFALVPLPPAYYDQYLFHRPEEFVPALFFLLALAGFLRKGDWRTDPVDHWLVLSLIAGLFGQAAYMAYSNQLFDAAFDIAHTLKIASYGLVLAGLLVSMHSSFRQVEQSRIKLRQTNELLRKQIAERRHAQNTATGKAEELAAKSQSLEIVHNHVDIGICQYDAEFRLVSFNQRAYELQDVSSKVFRIGANFEDIVRHKANRGEYGPGDAEEQVRIRVVRAKSLIPHRFERTRPDGTIVEIEGKPVAEGGFITTYMDITERKIAEETIRRMALEDALTGLPNRVQFRNRLLDALNQAQRTDRLVGVILLDLDDFKSVNDTLGHPVGDALLVEVAGRLTACARKSDTVARLGGDEFAIVATNAKSVDNLLTFADRIVEQLSKPFDLGGPTVHTATSIGITVYPHDDSEVDQLISNADLALYKAKAEGGSQYRLFDDEMNRGVHQRRSVELDLRKALENGEMRLHYQPQFDLRSGLIVGTEALLRWQHPDRGLLYPDEFIPVAESSRLIIPISEWVLDAACSQSTAWREAGLGSISVSVNMSPLHFKQDALLGQIGGILRDSGLSADKLELEITESMVMAGGADVVRLLERLKDLGVRLAIDDFGTGYSSLSYIKEFPVDRLKIDRSFVSEIDTKWDSAAICNSVIQLGHSLNLSVIAEGIEKSEQLKILAELGCDEGQGYLVSKPVEAPALAKIVQNHNPASILNIIDQASDKPSKPRKKQATK